MASANLWRANTPGLICPASGGVDWTADTIRCALYQDGWSPPLDTQTGYGNASEVPAGSGYTQGGVTLTGLVSAYSAASSYGQAWTASTPYSVGDIVRPSAGNGHVYICAVAGESAATEPVWTTGRGATQPADGGVTWVECGLGVLSLTCADPSWTVTGAISFRYAAFYSASATKPVANPYIAVVDFGATQTGPATGTLSLPVDVNGLMVFPIY